MYGFQQKMSVTKFMGCVCRQMTKSSILANKAEWSQEEEPEGFLGQSFGFNALYILMTSKSYVHPRLISSSDIHIHLLSDILVDLRGIQNVYPRLNIITTFPVNLILVLGITIYPLAWSKMVWCLEYSFLWAITIAKIQVPCMEWWNYVEIPEKLW